MNRFALVPGVLLLAGVTLTSCGGASTTKGTGSGLSARVLASQSVSAGSTFAGLVVVDPFNDTLPRVSPIGAGALNSPGLMAISASRATLIAFDAGDNTVQIVNTSKESVSGSVTLPGPTISMVIPPLSASVAFAAVPTGSVSDILPTPGAIVYMNLATNSTITTIGVPGAVTVVSNAGGTQLLAFSNDSDSVAVISPAVAVNPVDQGCDSGALTTACVLVPGFSRPVYAIYSSDGSTAYVLNCGLQCGGTQPASVAVFDTASLTVTNSIPVAGATWALQNGSTLYVAGTPPPPTVGANTCAGGPPTAATTCGRLSIVDLNSLAVVNTQPLYIPDGYHDRMDLSANGQLFIGSHTCTAVGDVNNPVGEVRGCLAIYNTGEGNVVIPPDNGDVTGLQGLTNRFVEYVAQGGNLRVYNTDLDILLLNADFIPTGTIPIVGVVVDVKEIDFF
ncbi:MAG TPA: hypothetical protein VIW68_01755 [Candidatus Sulfotelmatobacter sp.]